MPAPPTSDAPVQVEWVSEEGLRELADAWRELDQDPFVSPEWILTWWECFGRGRLVACTAWREGRLEGVLPLQRRGPRLLSPVNEHTPRFDIAARSDDARAAVLQSLVATRASAVVLDALRDDGATAAWLRETELPRLRVERVRHVSPWVETTGSFAEYRAQTRANWQAPLERLERKMVREQGAQFHLLQRPVDLELTLRQGFAVEASGWKGTGGTAITSRPETERFYRDLSAAFARRGELVLSWLTFGEKMVAFDLSLHSDGALLLLKTGYDESHSRLAPGLVLRLAVVRRCIELGIACHELLGDDLPWKRKFAQRAHRHVEIRLYRRDPLAAGQWSYRRWARPHLRTLYHKYAASRQRD